MTTILLMFQAFLTTDPALNKTEKDPVEEARRLLSSYQIVTLKHGDERWEFEPAAKGEKGVNARRTKKGVKIEFTLSMDVIGEVVGLTGAITDQRENFIALGVASANNDNSEIEYRTLSVNLNQEPLKPENWARSETLTKRPIASPFPLMAVNVSHGDSLTFSLQELQRDGETRISGQFFVHHCISARIKDTLAGGFERFEFASK